MGWIQTILGGIFTLSPIKEISLRELFSMYLSYFAVALTIMIPFAILFYRKREVSSLSFTRILIGVPIEDALFRLLPLKVLGKQATVYAHFIWALAHISIPQVIFVFIHGILDLRLWLGGLWMEAVFIHLFHDLLLLSILESIRGGRVK